MKRKFAWNPKFNGIHKLSTITIIQLQVSWILFSNRFTDFWIFEKSAYGQIDQKRNEMGHILYYIFFVSFDMLNTVSKFVHTVARHPVYGLHFYTFPALIVPDLMQVLNFWITTPTFKVTLFKIIRSVQVNDIIETESFTLRRLYWMEGDFNLLQCGYMKYHVLIIYRSFSDLRLSEGFIIFLFNMLAILRY